MTVRPINDPEHKCDLPPAGDYPLYAMVECTDLIWKGGNARQPCAGHWRRTERREGFGKKKRIIPQWERVTYEW